MNALGRLTILVTFHLAAILSAEENEVLLPLTRAEADQIVAAEMKADIRREKQRRHSIEAVQAVEVKIFTQGQDSVIMRRVPSKPWTFIPKKESLLTDSLNIKPQVPDTRFRSFNLSVTVFDRMFSELVWNKGEATYKILSNIDFNYLTVVTGFEDAGLEWSVFFMVDNVDTGLEKKAAAMAAKEGEEYLPRLMPETGSLVGGKPDYVVYAEHADKIPEELIVELNTLHRYYAANEETLKVTWQRQKIMNEARSAWLAANPPVRKPTVTNFWPVRSELYGKKRSNSPKP